MFPPPPSSSLSLPALDPHACATRPATHPGKHGERCSYMYAVTSNNPGRCFPFQIVIKVNLEAQGVSGWWECPPHCFLGEPIFVDSKATGAQEEDAGWVLVVMYDCGEGAGRGVGGGGGAAAAAGVMSAEQDMSPREIQGSNRPGRCASRDTDLTTHTHTPHPRGPRPYFMAPRP